MVSQGNSLHSKHNDTFLINAHFEILQNLLSLGLQPSSPLGQVLLTILGHFSQAIPHTAIFIVSPHSLIQALFDKKDDIPFEFNLE